VGQIGNYGLQIEDSLPLPPKLYGLDRCHSNPIINYQMYISGKKCRCNV